MSRLSDESSAGEDGDKLKAEAGGEATRASVGRMVDSSQADDRRLIQLVRRRQLLYARNNMPVASYYARVKKHWEEVAYEMGRTVAEVRRKWSHIRNSYSRHLRNEVAGARTGRGRAVSRWYLADELEFLKEHMATDTRNMLSSSSPTLYAFNTPTYEQVGDGTERVAVDVKPFANPAWLSACSTAVREAATRVEPKQDPHSVYSGGEDSSSSFTVPPNEEEAAYFQFFRGLYGDYSELCAQRRRLFRRQCLALLHALLDEQDAQAHVLEPQITIAPASTLHSTNEDDSILPHDD